METRCQNKMLLMNIVSLNTCCCSVTKSCLTLCDSIDCSTPGLPVPRYLSEFAQVRVHWIGDVIQPSHPLLPFSPSAFNLCQHQGLLQGVCSSHWVAKLLELQHHPSNKYSGLTSFRTDWFDLLVIQGLSRVFSNTTVQKNQFFNILPSLWSNSHIGTRLQERA